MTVLVEFKCLTIFSTKPVGYCIRKNDYMQGFTWESQPPSLMASCHVALSLHLRVPRFPIKIFSSISRIWSRRIRSTVAATELLSSSLGLTSLRLSSWLQKVIFLIVNDFAFKVKTSKTSFNNDQPQVKRDLVKLGLLTVVFVG